MTVSTDIAEQLKDDISSAMQESVGFNQELLQSLSNDFLMKLQKKWGGQRIYIPVQGKKQRDEMVLCDLGHQSHAKVMKKYDISLSTLYRIMGK